MDGGVPGESYPCIFPHCSKSYKRLVDLKAHTANHRARGSSETQLRRRRSVYQCSYPTCPEVFARDAQRLQHERTHWSQDVRFSHCPWAGCSSVFTDPVSLKAHYGSHLTSTDMPECPHPRCSLAFDSPDELHAHVASVHPDLKPSSPPTFPCTNPACAETFASHAQLAQHIQSAHSSSPPMPRPPAPPTSACPPETTDLAARLDSLLENPPSHATPSQSLPEIIDLTQDDEDGGALPAPSLGTVTVPPSLSASAVTSSGNSRSLNSRSALQGSAGTPATAAERSEGLGSTTLSAQNLGAQIAGNRANRIPEGGQPGAEARHMAPVVPGARKDADSMQSAGIAQGKQIDGMDWARTGGGEEHAGTRKGGAGARVAQRDQRWPTGMQGGVQQGIEGIPSGFALNLKVNHGKAQQHSSPNQLSVNLQLYQNRLARQAQPAMPSEYLGLQGQENKSDAPAQRYGAISQNDPGGTQLRQMQVTRNNFPQTGSSHAASSHAVSASHAVSSHVGSPHVGTPHVGSPHVGSPHVGLPHVKSSQTRLPYAASPHAASPRVVSPHAASPHAVSPHAVSPHAVSPHAVSPRAVSPHAVSSHAVSSHAVSSHAASPHAVSSHAVSPRGVSSLSVSSRAALSRAASSRAVPSYAVSSSPVVSFPAVPLHTVSPHAALPHAASSCPSPARAALLAGKPVKLRDYLYWVNLLGYQVLKMELSLTVNERLSGCSLEVHAASSACNPILVVPLSYSREKAFGTSLVSTHFWYAWSASRAFVRMNEILCPLKKIVLLKVASKNKDLGAMDHMLDKALPLSSVTDEDIALMWTLGRQQQRHQ